MGASKDGPMQVLITRSAMKDIEGLEPENRSRIIGVLDRLALQSRAMGLKKVHGMPNTWRLRVGDWRVILRLDPPIIYVVRVKHRSEAYR